MIKSKRKTLIHNRRMTKVLWKLDSAHNWEYEGSNQKLGDKYSSTNLFVNHGQYVVKKGFKQGKELADV